MSDSQDRGLPGLSIRRPMLVAVMNLLILLAGLGAILGVEVRELPDVDRPVVSVRANFPGGSPETLDAEVTSKVEGAVARVSGVLSIRSSSEEDNFRIFAEFAPGADLDVAAADVREAVSRVQRELPDGVEQLTVVKSDSDAEPVVRLAAWSDSLSQEALTDVVENDILPNLVSLPGVADVTLNGDREQLLRVIVDPLRLASFGLSITDVSATLRDAPFDKPVGSFRSVDMELLVRADANAITADAVEDLLIDATTRIGDVAQVTFGPKDATSYVRLNGRPVIGLGIIRQAGANTITISNGVAEAVVALNQRFDNVTVEVTSDDAVFIKGSIREVAITLAIAVVIVILTLWLFLGSFRATLVPSVAIPIALIGTVAAIWLVGFSINLLTLLALVLATGMIVDDAIVVLENVQRRKAQGLGARAAAVLGTRQVFFAILATTATLIAVFVPIAFLPGTAGRLFREFGFVLAIAVAISSFVALSLVPMLSARIGDRPPRRPRLFVPVARFGGWLAHGYDRALKAALAAPLVVLAAALGFAGLAWVVYLDLPKELLPSEDRGQFFIVATGPDGVGLPYTERQAEQVEAVLRPYVDSGEITSLFTIVGRWDLNRTFVLAPLAPWDERERGQQEIVAELRGKMAALPGVVVWFRTPNSLGLRGNRGNLEVALIGTDYSHLFEASKVMARAIEDETPNLSNPEISYQPTQPQLSIKIDRRRAADLGVPLADLTATLRAMVDGDEIADLNVAGRAVPILLQSASGQINDPTDLTNLFVRAADGRLVPLTSLVTLEEAGVAAELDRHAQRRAVEIDASLADGYPLANAVADAQALADRLLPAGAEMILLGEAKTLQETSSTVGITYAVALLVVFLVLAAQFESLTSAAVIVVTVPFGLAAAVFALLLTGTSINIYSQIGLIMLIGLMAKNGILLVEFADQLRDQGHSVRQAVTTSARVRLRPIVMTLLSTILGGLPLILGSGPGAEARAAIGWVAFGGLGLAAIFTLFLTPVVYLFLAGLSKPRVDATDRLKRELRDADQVHDDALEQAAE
ncbi:MAG: efflux RND transporter permease subunit [Alphaproteobacteria bacterium]